MRLIGLTGGIATGKSTVAGLLAAHGAAIVDADGLAREVLLPGTPAYDDVVARFGAGVLNHAGAIDRPGLGAIVFADPALRGELERITHPRISALMQKRIAAALASTAPLVVADIALLFEGRRDHDFEGTMLVYAPATTQLHRLQARDGLDDLAARQRLLAQLPIDDKRGLATWVIDNSGSRESTAAQVDAWWRKVVAPL
jgi:dephospho-CoA kinase